MRRARDGDHDAYAQLVTAHVDRLNATAYLIVRDRASAEDAVQDAFLRAWRDLPALREITRFDAWLRRLLVNACLDQLRRRGRRPAEVSLAHHHEPATLDATNAVADRDLLGRAFEALGPDHRTIVVLTHFEGLSQHETAALLHIPLGTVKSRLHHALRAMRAAIEADARAPSRAGGTR